MTRPRGLPPVQEQASVLRDLLARVDQLERLNYLTISDLPAPPTVPDPEYGRFITTSDDTNHLTSAEFTMTWANEIESSPFTLADTDETIRVPVDGYWWVSVIVEILSNQSGHNGTMRTKAATETFEVVQYDTASGQFYFLYWSGLVYLETTDDFQVAYQRISSGSWEFGPRSYVSFLLADEVTV